MNSENSSDASESINPRQTGYVLSAADAALQELHSKMTSFLAGISLTTTELHEALELSRSVKESDSSPLETMGDRNNPKRNSRSPLPPKARKVSVLRVMDLRIHGLKHVNLDCYRLVRREL